MIIKRNFHFPIALLFSEAELILTTAESPEEKDQIKARLDDAPSTPPVPGKVASLRAILDELNPATGGIPEIRGELGTFTATQRAAISQVKKFKARARKSARHAFRGQSVKLSETFLVGNDEGTRIGIELDRADTILAGCTAPQNVGPMKSLGGWIGSDNTAFAAAIATARKEFKDHLDAESDSLDDTNDYTQKANTLNLGLLTIQMAANNQHPEEDPATRGIREKYRFGHFPPPSDNPTPAVVTPTGTPNP